MNYDIGDFDNNGILKPGAWLLLATVYLSRYVLYGPISIIASLRGRGGSGAQLDLSFLQLESPWELLLGVPSLLVLFAMMRRRAEAGELVRSIWRNGKSILIASVLLHLGFLAYEAYQMMGSRAGIDPLTIISGIVDLYILYYLLTYTRITDVFAMFPERGK